MNIKVGDLVTAYQKGYHVVVDVQKNETYNNYLVHYRTVMTAGFKPSNSKKVKVCDSSYCSKIDRDWILTERDKQLKTIQDGFSNLLNLFESYNENHQQTT